MWLSTTINEAVHYLKQGESISYLADVIHDNIMDLKREAVRKANTLVAEEDAEDFLKNLSDMYWEGNDEAVNLAHKLGLGRQHFDAIDDNHELFDEMGKELYKELTDYDIE